MKQVWNKLIKCSVIMALCCMITLLCNIPVGAAESDGFQYKDMYGEYYGESGVEIYRYTGTETDVVIPEMIDGKQVIKISGFENYEYMQSVEIPKSVRIIGGEAFKGCTGLKSVIISDGVARIDAGAFMGCTSLTSVKIPDSVIELSDYAFANCTSLENVELSRNLDVIDYCEFSGCSNLERIVIPEGVTSIEDFAFEKCGKLKEVILPASLTKLGGTVFADDSSLTNIDLPDGLTEMGGEIFRGCINLESIVIPQGVKIIGWEAFSGCSSLSYVEIPKGVEFINYKAFGDCDSLSCIVLPESLGNLYESFLGSDNLEIVVIKAKRITMQNLFSKGTNPVVYAPTGWDANKYADANGLQCKPLEEWEQVNSFAERLYTLVLGRGADGRGLLSWSSALLQQKSSGVDVGYGFVFSGECQERGLSDEDFVNMLYLTFMNRPSDDAGRNAWVSQLETGVEREKVFEGFVYSDEFRGICEEYGIEVGNTESVNAFAEALGHYRNQNADITAFVARCYTKAMERPFDPVGLEDWCRVIVTKDDTPTNVAKCFIFSDEFIAKNLSDEEYVKVLYQTFMGREADEVGLAGWISVLQSGEEDREKVLDGFAGSLEFAEILEGFGLN